IVAASSATRGIGLKGELPWNNLSNDMKYFAKITIGNYPPNNSSSSSSTTTATTTAAAAKQKMNAVVMGRKTWNSIPTKYRPLKGRHNVVLTRDPKQFKETLTTTSNDNVLVANGLQDAWRQLAMLKDDELGEIFIIGGSELYERSIKEKYVHSILLTSVETPPEMEFDTFFPDFLKDGGSNDDDDDDDDESPTWKLSVDDDEEDEEVKIRSRYGGGLSYKMLKYVRSNQEEVQYLSLIRKILKNGIVRGDRTGTGTKSLFGAQMRFDLRDGTLPLLTTKKTFWRGVAEELLWFISGSTNANLLKEKKVRIWDGNASKEFLESRGLGHREEGDLGPVYGFQWRHFGADYIDMHTDYTGKGVDQLAQCIDKIKNNPEDRRILMSAWNPSALDEMALPPCHLLCQFYVDTTANEVSCHMYQRSADMGLGVPFNIASYALLTHLIAHVTGRKPGELVHTLGDAHVYMNHIEPLKEQLERTPRPFPKLFIDDNVGDDKTPKSIDDFTYEDLHVVGYHPHEKISMKMAV
ncbi:Thymidylat_synt-domain-containing protein, partial [Fragilariopsis cylindrus CCMP1102]